VDEVDSIANVLEDGLVRHVQLAAVYTRHFSAVYKYTRILHAQFIHGCTPLADLQFLSVFRARAGSTLLNVQCYFHGSESRGTIYTRLFTSIYTRTDMNMRRYRQHSTPKNILLLKSAPYNLISVYNHILYGRRRGRRCPLTVGWSIYLYLSI